MKPFKFFFALALGLMAFFFLARVVFAALFIAAIMSMGYFLFRKVVGFFHHLSWENQESRYDYYSNEDRPYERTLPGWKFENDLLVDDWEHPRERVFAERIIPVR